MKVCLTEKPTHSPTGLSAKDTDLRNVNSLHRAKSLNQVLPQEKHVNGENFDTFSKENILKGYFGRQMLTNISKLK